MTQSEDDLDLSVARSRRLRSKRGSIPNNQEIPAKRSRHSGLVSITAIVKLRCISCINLICNLVISLPIEELYQNHMFYLKKKSVEVATTEQLIAKTIVSFPKDGPVQAVASVETYPSATTGHGPSYAKPSAPPLPTSGENN